MNLEISLETYVEAPPFGGVFAFLSTVTCLSLSYFCSTPDSYGAICAQTIESMHIGQILWP